MKYYSVIFAICVQMYKINMNNILTSFRVFRHQCHGSLLQKDCCQFLAVLSANTCNRINT